MVPLKAQHATVFETSCSKYGTFYRTRVTTFQRAVIRMDTASCSRRCRWECTLLDAGVWYRDALIYQTHVRAFFDSNNDGVGDFRGLKLKLDAITILAAAIWDGRRPWDQSGVRV